MSQVSLQNIKYIVEVDHVREVILVGRADFAFWEKRLGAEGLVPFKQNGKAEISISATDLKWNGVRFNELTISIPVGAREGTGLPEGAFLIHAYNSMRGFAFIERKFFQTPYFPGKIEVEDRIPARIGLRLGQETVFKAQMMADPTRVQREEQAVEGPVFLPASVAKNKKPGNFFYAYLGGVTDIYAFSPESSSCEIKPPQNEMALQWLKASNFEPKEWRIRNRALHKKSETYSPKK